MTTDRRRDDFSAAELLRESGARPAPPSEHLESIRAAAKAEWRRHYADSPEESGEDRERAHRRPALHTEPDQAPPRQPLEEGSRKDSDGRELLWLAAASILVTGVLFWSWVRQADIADSPGGSSAVAVATLDRIVGEARQSEPTGLSTQLRVGDVLLPTSEISTSENADSMAALTLSSGHSLRIGSRSRVRIAGDGVVELLGGRLYIASRGEDGAEADQVTVETVLGSVREIGTQFEVVLVEGLDGTQQLRTRVREGEVLLRVRQPSHQEDLTVGAGAGEQLVADSRAGVMKSAIKTYGDEWQWILAGATSFELDGRTGAQLLQWLARETGRDVSYRDSAAQRAAGVAFDAGSGVARHDSALDVLLTLDLLARFDEGKILVEVR